MINLLEYKLKEKYINKIFNYRGTPMPDAQIYHDFIIDDFDNGKQSGYFLGKYQLNTRDSAKKLSLKQIQQTYLMMLYKERDNKDLFMEE